MLAKPDSNLLAVKRWTRVVCLVIFAWMGLASASAGQTLTNAAQLRRFAAAAREAASSAVRLEGVVLWASRAQDQVVIQDTSGAVMVKLDSDNHPVVHAGHKVLIGGICLASREGIAFRKLIDNDGIHPGVEKSAGVFLSAGLHPISVEWFNGPAHFELNLECRGPDMPRQRVPDGALSRTEEDPATGTNRLAQGLDYRCYEGKWDRLPDFSQLPVLKNGAVSNLDLQVRTRDTDVGLAFTGYFKVSQPGKYSFWLKSDDGSRLHIGDQLTAFKVLGEASLPPPHHVFPGRPIAEEQELQWAEVEGIVTRVSEIYGGVYIELTSEAGRAYLKVADGKRDYLKLLPHSRIRVMGVCNNACDIDGQAVPSLWVQNVTDIAIIDMAPEHWADYPISEIHSVIETNHAAMPGAIIHVSGTVRSNTTENLVVIDDGTDRILMEPSQASPRPGDQVEVLGWWSREAGDEVLRHGFYRRISQKLSSAEGLPVLTEAIQVKTLNRAEAQRGYPVKIQGVVTANIGGDFVIQDSTAPVFVQWNASLAEKTPEIGDYWEIEGESYMHFAPNIRGRQATYLGSGILPEPIRPGKDELINGSLDTRYVELLGIAVAVKGKSLTLLTREGKIGLVLQGLDPAGLQVFKDAFVYVRGVTTPDRDAAQRISSRVIIFGASVSLVEAAPLLPFQTQLKRVSDLLSFDARADSLRRVKVAGQILHERNGQYFLLDEASGLRFEPQDPVKLPVGDKVEVVGFPDISGPSPVLREALVRVTGKAELSSPPLSNSVALSGNLDATLVCVKSRLVSLSSDDSDQVMVLQSGTHNFQALLAKARGAVPYILPGSVLQVTGTYAGHGGDRASGRNIDSFDLLLNSPDDIRVLERPSRWTFRHTLTVLLGMTLAILAALGWVSQLRRQVKLRTMQLSLEIKSREQAEYHRALEEERARIASDLHDEVGATLTEIRFLGAVASSDPAVPETTRSRLTKVSEKSNQMVSALDEIVWAINPANDLLPKLGNYLCHVAEDFFRNTEVRCRLDVDESLPPVILAPDARHNLYLVVREALNNVAKHSKASEACLRVHCLDKVLHVAIEDNGCGFQVAANTSRNGLANMQHRLERIGGRFECESRIGSGTTCRIILPLK